MWCSSTSKSGPRIVCFFDILTSKCASHHHGVHFFDISTSKSGPRLSENGVFCAFWLRHNGALLQHLNFQKCSDIYVFCACWHRNVLRATAACTLSSLIWPDSFAPAASASLLFDPPEPQIIGQTQWVATFLPFRAPASSFFWLFLFSDFVSSSLLFSSLLWLFPPLLFICPCVHIVGSLTSKLWSII